MRFNICYMIFSIIQIILYNAESVLEVNIHTYTHTHTHTHTRVCMCVYVYTGASQ